MYDPALLRNVKWYLWFSLSPALITTWDRTCCACSPSSRGEIYDGESPAFYVKIIRERQWQHLNMLTLTLAAIILLILPALQIFSHFKKHFVHCLNQPRVWQVREVWWLLTCSYSSFISELCWGAASLPALGLRYFPDTPSRKLSEQINLPTDLEMFNSAIREIINKM